MQQGKIKLQKIPGTAVRECERNHVTKASILVNKGLGTLLIRIHVTDCSQGMFVYTDPRALQQVSVRLLTEIRK